MGLYFSVRKKDVRYFIFVFIFRCVFTDVLQASPQTEAGLTLLEVPSARPAALGEAYTAATNDISAFAYNPSSLHSLKEGQASFLFQRGVADDSYAHLMAGFPLKKSHVAFSVGYYDGGDISIYDGFIRRDVTVQRDMTAAVGVARQYKSVSWGLAGKYVSSELAETYKASAMALDAGVMIGVSPHIRLGAAVQNYGGQLTYVSEGDDLPRVARVGAAFDLFPRVSKTELLIDAPYYMNREKIEPALGLEYRTGPLALRMGYKSGRELEEFSFGTGIFLGASSFDYAFGLVDNLDSRHRISFAFRFGANAPARKTLEPQQRATVKYYTVKKGDTLPIIAGRMYGKKELWRKIFIANKHLLDDPNTLEVGQRLILPEAR